MANNIDYSQQRSLNVGIAIDTGSLGAAAIYDDLVYAQKVFGEGYFYRSYEQMMKRFPMWSERTLRTYIKKLETAGWINTKVMKVEGRPICHYKICRFLSAKVADTMEMAKIAETYNDKETKKETKSSADAKSLLALVNEITGRDFRTLPRGYKKTLDTFTLVEIEGSLRALAADSWHQPKLKSLSSDYFLRATTIDRFRGKAPAPGESTVRPTFTEDEEGNNYYKGELITPQNQQRILRESNAEREAYAQKIRDGRNAAK